MLYYALVDISAFGDADTEYIRENISGHFADKASLKRKESVIGKALLCLILEEKFGVTDFAVDCKKNGKPFIVDSNIFFNISHSGKYVLCTVGDENNGCDIQQFKPYNNKVVKRFFAYSEQLFLEKSENQSRDFAKFWTLKESALKFSGEGMSGGLDRYDFSGYYNKNSFKLEELHFNVFEMQEYFISICSVTGEIIKLNADVLKRKIDL